MRNVFSSHFDNYIYDVRNKNVTNNYLSSTLLHTVDYQDKTDPQKITEY